MIIQKTDTQTFEQDTKMMIIAVDYDETIVQDSFPHVGTLKPDAKEVINELYDNGHFIIIWTCRHGENADDAHKFLTDNGIKFHSFNEHKPENIEKYGNDTRKIFADIYIDDKNLGGLPETWKEIREVLKTKHLI